MPRPGRRHGGRYVDTISVALKLQRCYNARAALPTSCWSVGKGRPGKLSGRRIDRETPFQSSDDCIVAPGRFWNVSRRRSCCAGIRGVSQSSNLLEGTEALLLSDLLLWP
jgi:hypothetical protein